MNTEQQTTQNYTTERVQSPAQAESVIDDMFEKNKTTPVRNVSKPLTQIYWTCQAYTWLCIQMTSQHHHCAPEHEDYADKDRCPQYPSHSLGKGCSVHACWLSCMERPWLYFWSLFLPSLHHASFPSPPIFLLISVDHYNPPNFVFTLSYTFSFQARRNGTSRMPINDPVSLCHHPIFVCT
jgi:hypothetical protein